MADESGIHFYSIGAIAEDKVNKTKRVKIIPLEITFLKSVKIDDQENEVERTHGTTTGSDNFKVKESKAIEALWWNFNSNRVTPPNVKKNDQVIILQLGETDIYFWLDLNSANVKRLEDVIYSYSADPTHQTADDLSNAYVVNVSPEQGHVTLRTSKCNGESNSFLFQFNTRDGSWVCIDDLGNKFYHNCQEYDLGFENAQGSKVNINKEKIFLTSVDEVVFETRTFRGTCETFHVDATGSATFVTPKWTADAPETVCTGNLLVEKDFRYNGEGTGIGDFTVKDAVIANVRFSVHTHREQGDGQLVSKPQ